MIPGTGVEAHRRNWKTYRNAQRHLHLILQIKAFPPRGVTLSKHHILIWATMTSRGRLRDLIKKKHFIDAGIAFVNYTYTAFKAMYVEKGEVVNALRLGSSAIRRLALQRVTDGHESFEKQFALVSPSQRFSISHLLLPLSLSINNILLSTRAFRTTRDIQSFCN